MTLHEYAAKAAAAADYVRDRIEAYRSGSTPQQARSARLRAAEFATEAATVDRALAMDTPESDVQLTVQLAAWDAEISRLLTLPRARTATENAQLASMSQQRNAMEARLRGAGAVPDALLSDFGAVGRPKRLLGALAAGGPVGWLAGGLAVAVALLGLQSARLSSVKGELAERTTERDAALQYGNEMAALAETRENDIAGVREENTQSREVIESVQARNARLEARERERTRLAQENSNAATVDFSDRLRDLTVQPFLSAPAPSGDPASGVSDAPSGDPAT